MHAESRCFWIVVGATAVAIALGCWLASGTVAPYGTYVFGDCQYRMNGDHGQFESVFRMLDGRPSVEWDYSVVLRRVLHPLLAFPFMKWLGFEAGGVLFNMLLHAAALVALAVAVRRYYDARAAMLVSCLLASFPGYAYWGGLAYSYAWIVPGSIFCTIGLLWWHDRPSLSRTAVVATLVGVVGLGYDLMPFFGGALLLLLAAKRRWLDIPVTLLVLVAWALFIGRGIPAIFGFSSSNDNTAIYGVVVRTWLQFWQHTSGWPELLLDLPRVFISNFFFSAHVFLPLLFVVIVAHHLRYRVRPILGPVALAIAIATLGVWVFLNAAPPYGGPWLLRGTWIARLYQPWFVIVLLVVAGASIALRNTSRHKLLVGSVVAVCIAGWLAIAGPYVRVFAVYMTTHQNFYQHWSLSSNWRWMHRLGVRPIGVCRKALPS